MLRRYSVFALLVVGVFLAGLALLLPAGPALAEGAGVTVSEVQVSDSSPYQGQSVQVGFVGDNSLSEPCAVSVQLISPSGGVYLSQNVVLPVGPSSQSVGFQIGDCVATGLYRLSIQHGGVELLDPEYPVNVNIRAPQVEVSIVAPTGTNPATVAPGGKVTVAFRYKSPDAAAKVDISVGNLVSQSVSLAKKSAWTDSQVTLTIPTGAPEGKYAVCAKRCGTELDSFPNAVEVKKEPALTAVITAPTPSEPVSVKPGSSVRVYYRYTASESFDVDFKILKADGGAVATTKVSLAKAASATNKYVDITVPSGTAPGRYDLAITDRPAGKELSRAKEAVRVLENATVSITAPRKTGPVLVAPGAKVTVSFEYTANPKTEADVKIVKADGSALVASKVTLDRTTSKKTASATLTVPSNAAAARYSVVVSGRVSGGTLAEEQEAVLVEPKIEATITAPTRAKPELLNPGEKLSVSFDYTAVSAADVDLKLVGAGGKVLVTRQVSLSRATTKRSQTVSVTLPSSAAHGKYDLVLAGNVSGQVLAAEKEAVLLETRVDARIISPARAAPVVLKPGERLNVSFEYAADTDVEVDLKLVGVGGNVLATHKVSLSRAITKRTQTASLTIPAAAEGRYDLVLASRISGTTFAVEREAVHAYPYPVGVTVRFALGQAGRWVDGTYQTTDCAPLLRFNRTLLPIRHLGEPLGWQLQWDGERKMATVTKGLRQVRVWVDHPGARISSDGGKTWQAVPIDPDDARVVPVIVSGRTMLPLRFVAESLNTNVQWDNATKTVTVTQ